MRQTRIVSALVVLLVVLSGCIGGIPGSAGESTQTTTSTSQTPQKGTEFLSVSNATEEQVMSFDENVRTSFENLTDTQQEVFLKALRSDGKIEQSAFDFHDEDRPKFVKYREKWYSLRVTIV